MKITMITRLIDCNLSNCPAKPESYKQYNMVSATDHNYSMPFRRRRHRNYTSTTMNYMNLHSDEEDDDLLDDVSDHEENNENNRRLSLISAASDDNLLRTEAPC